MADIFDEIEVDGPDIFDEIAPEPKGDIFDEISDPNIFNMDAGRLPDLQATTRGGAPLNLPGGAARSTLGEVAGEFGQFWENIHTPTFELAKPLSPQEVEQLRGEERGTQRAAGTYQSLANTANFFTSPMGVATLGIGFLPRALQRAVAGVFAAQMASQVPELSRQLGEELAKPEGERDQMRLAELITTGATTTGFATLAGKHALTPTPKAIRLAEEIEASQFTPREQAPTPIRELGIPQSPLTLEPFLQPGVPRLADLALAEAQRRIQVPGETALDVLRREVAPPVIEPVTVRGRERPIEAGETVVQPAFEGVKVAPGFRRSASDLLLEQSTRKGAPDALVQETTQPVRVVREEPVQIPEEVPVPAHGREADVRGNQGRAEAEALIETAQPLNPGGALKDLPPDLQARSNAVKEAMRAEFEALKKKDGEKAASKSEEVAPDVQMEVTPATTTGTQRVKLSNSPQTYTVLERLAQTEVEKANNEQPVRIRNERTGKEEVVMESELTQVAEKTEAKPKRTKADLNKALRDAGLDPSVFPDAKSKKNALDRAIAKLEEAQQRLRGSRATLSMGVPKAILDLALETAILTLKAGKTIGEAMDAAIKKVRYNAKGFDEAQVRKSIEDALLKETGTTKTYPVEGETVQMRKSAERATESPMIPKDVQERIAEAPESFYQQQSMRRVEDAVATMNDVELSGVPRDSNLYTAARLEQAKRLFDAGKNDEGYNVFVELEKEGTRLGQLINQFKLLKGNRPENVVRVINSELKSKGKDPLNEAQRKQATDLATKAIESDRTLESATREWQKNPSNENAAAAEKALLDSNAAALELQRFSLKFQPRTTPAILKSVLQGNLLTPISEVANIFGNMSFLPFRAADRTIASGLDVVDSFIRQRPREITTQPIKGTVEAAKGVMRGMKDIPDILLRGSGNVIKGETRAGLHPVKAWIDQFAKNPEMPTTGGRLTLNDRLNLAIEGTFGVPAEIMLRGLGSGDQPFRQAARYRIIANEAKLAKIPDAQLPMARNFPELFFDESTLQRINRETAHAIFQRESQTLNYITRLIRGRGEWFDLAAATVAPYKLTPWNIIGETLSYNPLIAMARTLYDAKRGDSRSAKLNAGKLFVGSALTAAAWWLYSKGLLSPSLDERNEAQKGRLLAADVIPPNHINISGLKRALAGGDPEFKAGDETVDVMRAGGLAGSIFYMTANIGRDFERKPEVGDEELWLSILKQSGLEQARFGLNQSFLSGVEGILTAVKDGNTDTYLQKWMNTVASIPMPNSLSTLSRTTREYKPDFSGETLKQMENVIRNRIGFAGLDDYLPLKRDFFGEPLRETPEGRNAIMYQFFDISKNRQVTDDPLKLELYRLWRKTGESEIIPSLPGKSITVKGQTYLLTPEQRSEYARLVGSERKKIAEAMVINPEFHKLNDEQKIRFLKRAYDKGAERGKGLFWRDNSSKLEAKKERAGFEVAR